VNALIADETDAGSAVIERPTHGKFPVADAIVMCEEILRTLYDQEARAVVAYLVERVKDL
jgi:hypothetical protein